MKSILKSLYQNSRNEEIKKLIFDALNKESETYFWVAKNIDAPVSILEYLSNSKIIGVRMFVAGNTSTPVSILEKLSNDKNYHVRTVIAENINTPEYILEKLSKDKNYNVREWVFINPIWKIRNNALTNKKN